MSRTAPLAALSLVTLVTLALTACAPATDPQTVVTPTATPSATGSANTAQEQRDAALDRREADYQAAVAAWPDAPPAGYAWPASVRDLPAGAVGQQRELQEPRNVYRCMLIDAAWNAYFEDNDAEASLALGARADELWDGSMSSVYVMNEDGTIFAQNLAAANGICQYAVGDLKSAPAAASASAATKPDWQDYAPEQVEWCSNITSAWEAYFQQGDEPTAVARLQAAAAVDPGSFGWIEDAVHTRAIDRDVRFIGGGVDSQYVEYTANGCWDWAERVGVDIP